MSAFKVWRKTVHPRYSFWPIPYYYFVKQNLSVRKSQYRSDLIIEQMATLI